MIMVLQEIADLRETKNNNQVYVFTSDPSMRRKWAYINNPEQTVKFCTVKSTEYNLIHFRGAVCNYQLIIQMRFAWESREIHQKISTFAKT